MTLCVACDECDALFLCVFVFLYVFVFVFAGVLLMFYFALNEY